MRSPVQTRFEDLPQEIAIFPLSGALLLPWGRLPLNIFEPRYLNMCIDALKNGRIFGMIQPDPDKTPKDKKLAENVIQESEPALYHVGCAGRIASFEETDDGRLLILVKGLARFRVVKEIEGHGGYRRVHADYSDFHADMEPPPKFDFHREQFMHHLKPYIEAQSMPVNLEVLKGLTDSTLITSLCMICPFDPREKQALLEAATVAERVATLEKLLQMGVFEKGIPGDTPKQ
jgi:Lon protease-like protein